jgi:hypothetical protein
MALEVGSRTEQARRFQVMVSELHELNFALFLIQCHELRGKHEPPPWIAQFQRDHVELYERIRAFWADGASDSEQRWQTEPGYFAWDEMLVAAYHSGTVRDDGLGRFFQRLPRALEREMVVPPLPTETPDVPGIVESRLGALRDSAELREQYVSMLKETWEALTPMWEAEGRDAAAQAARAFRSQPANIDELRKMAPGCSMLRREDYEEIISGALERSEVLLVPLWFAGDGQSLFSLPGTLLIGVGLESSRKLERRRAQAEKAAGRLKVLSDPTRVAMLMQLVHHAATITDLSNYFELSQPTVSVHEAVAGSGAGNGREVGERHEVPGEPGGGAGARVGGAAGHGHRNGNVNEISLRQKFTTI